MKCKKCGKPMKENTEGNNRYCQGHSILDETRTHQVNKQGRLTVTQNKHRGVSNG